MHPHDIKAFAQKVALQEAYGNKNRWVLIKAEKDGKTLWMSRAGFVEDKTKARPFNFDADGVAEQLFQAALQTGHLLDVEPIPADPDADEFECEKCHRIGDVEDSRAAPENRLLCDDCYQQEKL